LLTALAAPLLRRGADVAVGLLPADALEITAVGAAFGVAIAAAGRIALALSRRL
jgi:hypothetical protein